MTSLISKPPRGVQGWLVLLGCLTAVAPISIDMYLPSFPQVAHDLVAPPGRMEFTLASFFIGLTIGQLFYGPLSDRFGRKPPLYFGFALYTAASLGCILAGSVDLLCLFRFLQGLGGCAGIIISNAIVRDRTSARETARAFSMLMLVMGLAPILAPLAGGLVLTLWGWRAIFVVLSLFGVICLASITFGLSESHDTKHEPPLRLRTILANYAHLLTDRSFIGFALSGGLTMAGMFAYIAGSPFVLMELYGVEPRHYGWFFGVNAFGLIASSQLNARTLKYFPATAILRRGLWVPPLAGLVLAGLSLGGLINLPWFVVGFFCFVSSIGWIAPNAMASALATHGQMAGTAAALAGALQFFFATLAGVLVGAFHNGTGQPLAVVMALCGCGAFACHRLLAHTAPPASSSDPHA